MKTEASSGNEKSAVVGEAATVISPTPTKAAAKMEPGVGVKQKLRPRKRIKAGEERLGTGSGSDVGSAVSSPHARRSEERFTPGNSSNISSRQEKHSFEAVSISTPHTQTEGKYLEKNHKTREEKAKGGDQVAERQETKQKRKTHDREKNSSFTLSRVLRRETHDSEENLSLSHAFKNSQRHTLP